MPDLPASKISLVDSIGGLAERTKVWLVDLWGVIHNGVAPFPDAVAACGCFREQGGIVILLSNAPRPWGSVAEQLDRIGVAPEAYDAIVSSGDAARVILRARGRASIYHLGPDRDLGLYDGLGVLRVDAGRAEAVVCTGLFDDETETPEDYRTPLKTFAARGLPMICANPDLAVERGKRVIPCAGAVAKFYEELGGAVTYAGKPHPLIYELAFKAIETIAGGVIAKEKILAIGDGVLTDIAGAAAAGVPSVFVASGVHVKNGAALDEATLLSLFPEEAGRPLAAMTGLRW